MGKPLQIKYANPEVLIWAREGIGFDIATVASKTKLKADIIEAIEGGSLTPTKTQLVKLALAYKRPWTLFLLPHTPRFTKKKPKWRLMPSIIAALSQQSLLVIRRAEDLQEIYSELRVEEKSDMSARKFDRSDDPETIGQFLRKTLGVSVNDQSEWDEFSVFDRWRSVVERRGIVVAQGPLDPKEIRAFSVVENVPFIILVSSRDALNARTFSLFHELAHILIRDSSLCRMSDFSEYHARREESFCNQVAASFLVPKQDLIAHPLVQNTFHREWDDKTLSVLARRFKVSREVVLRRLMTVGLATQTFYEEKKAEWERIPPRKPFGINRDTPLRIMKGSLNANGYAVTNAVLESLGTGGLTLTRASDYLKLKPKYITRLETVFNWGA